MRPPRQFIIEGIDRVGKDTLVRGLLDRLGYHLVIHYSKPLQLACYGNHEGLSPERLFQEASFATLFSLISAVPTAPVICNRAHLGECVYGRLYRNYSPEYIFELERRFNVNMLTSARLVLLTEDFASAKHFRDDGMAIGTADKRPEEQALFLEAFRQSTFADKRQVCVTDPATGNFRDCTAILADVSA